MAAALSLGACEPSREPSEPTDDPHVVTNPGNLEEDRTFLSPPTLQNPIYVCTSSVEVSGFRPGARIDVFVDGDPAPIGTETSWLSESVVGVTIDFSGGQVVTATQTFDGATSDPSNAVVVSSHTEDYPDPPGLPPPWLDPPPLFQCGRAVGIRDVVPGADVRVFAENPDPDNPGDFLPPVQIGSTVGGSYAIVSPAFELDARIWAEYQICADVSPPSPAEIVTPEPSTIPVPSLDPVHESTHIVVVRDTVNGGSLEVLRQPGDVPAGGQPTPGGAGQQVFVDPEADPADSFNARQSLCSASDPSVPIDVVPCAELPPAKIVPPAPGDTQVTLTEWVPGATILVFADGQEIGDGGPVSVNLSRPLAEGETVTVVQRLGDCDSSFVYVIDAECANHGGDDRACSSDWPAFRHDGLRTAHQSQPSVIADPNVVKTLDVEWSFSRPGFTASPIVHEGMVYIGSADGHLYALDATDGSLQWQFPLPGEPPLTSDFTCNPSSVGIASSAAIATTREHSDVVIFGAPDRGRPDDPGGRLGAGFGSGRLFALDPSTGAEVWRSPEVAVLDGGTEAWPVCRRNADGSPGPGFDQALCDQALAEHHEQIGYSSPLVYEGRVYIGVANHCDNPIQKGRIAAVDVETGSIVGGFGFDAAVDSVIAADRGGGVWSSVAGGFGGAVYATTGNTKTYTQQPEPSTNHGLSLLRLDSVTGAVEWKLQPVPFDLDGDPDWASGPTLMSTACGELVASTMKDGWTYAVEAGDGTPGPPSVLWQSPPTGFPFAPGDGTTHGDSRYLMPSAAWRDVFITMTGGAPVTTDVNWGFNKLHALDACAGGSARWIRDVPGALAGADYQLGPPSVTGGIVFVGTAQGRLVAIADPSVYATAGSRCSMPGVDLADCIASGYQIVPIPRVIFEGDLRAGGVRGEPVIAGGRVYYAGRGGTLFALEPR